MKNFIDLCVMTWLLYPMAISLLILAGFYLFFLTQLRKANAQKSKQPKHQLPVSVVICARNEAANLRKNLPSILSQQYPEYEVIVVNDASTDGTKEVLSDFQEKHTHLSSIDLKVKLGGGKKQALTKGIEAAKYSLLLLTDADCRANSAQWIAEMTADLHENADLVLGYSPLEKQRGCLNKLIRFETLNTAILYLSFAIGRKPYMGVGRNMAYKKELFEVADGFNTHERVMSGDDDLFVNAMAKSANIAVCITENSWTIGSPEIYWNTWWRQKRRHMSAGIYYKREHLLLLGLFHGSSFVFYLLAILLLFSQFCLLAIGMVIFKLLMQMTIFRKLSDILGGKDLVKLILPLDFIYLIHILFTGISLMLKSPNRWK